MKKNKKTAIKKKQLDFSLLTKFEESKIYGAGYNYCPNSPERMCTQAIPVDQPGGGWVCPH